MSNTPLNEQSLKQIVATKNPPCVSIYVPAGGNSSQREQVRIRLKNQLAEADKALRARGSRPPQIDSILRPTRPLLSTSLIATRATAALALLASPGFFEILDLPQPTQDLTVVGDDFYVVPLLPMINGNRPFRLLALSQNEVRLFEGDRYSLRPVEVPKLPPGERPGSPAPLNLKAALRDDDDNADRTVQFHTGTQLSSGERPGVFHGQVNTREDVKERSLRFCQLVDHAIGQRFHDQDITLILAAAEPLPGVYRRANSCRNLYPRAIVGDPQLASDAELHGQAWQMMSGQAEDDLGKGLDRLREGLSKGRGTTDVASALAAAWEGRVEKLFLDADQPPARAGRALHAVNTHAEPLHSHAVRVNRLVVETVRNGGRAFTVPHDQLPEGAAVAALYRY